MPEVRRRAVAYVVTGLAVLAALALVYGLAPASVVAHRLVQTAAATIALVCGVLSLVRHYSRRERHFLFIGVTFLAVGVLDAFQVLALLRSPSPVATNAAQWSWLVSRFYLGFFLVRLAVAPRKPVRSDVELDENALYGTAGVLTTVGLLVLTLAPLPPLGVAVRTGGHIAAGLLFAFAAAANLRRGGWRRNVFEHWLVISLLLCLGAEAIAAATGVMLAARVAILLSYLAIFAGLLTSVYLTYAALEESRAALVQTNAALQREIADRQATERELQIRTAFLEHLFESTPEAVVVLDREDRVQRINAEFTRLFGYPPEDALGRPIGSLIVPPERALEADGFSADVAAGNTVSVETVRCRRDGSPVQVAILGTPVLVADGQIGVFGMYRDITDRKRAEEAMRLSAERLAAIIQAAPLAIFTLDGDGIVRHWNPAAERLTQRPAADVLGRPLPSFALGAVPADADPIRLALLGETLSRAETVWTRPNGSRVHVSIATAPLDAADTSAGVLFVAADVTESKRAEDAILRAKAAAEEANRAKSEFLASMSHELRTPLNSVIGFTKVLMKNRAGNLSPTDLMYLERIAANGEHLLTLINNVLDLSKIEAGMLQFEIGPTDVGILVRETVAQLEGRVTSGSIALRTQLPAHMAPIETDAHRLRQVLINLVGNAIKFTEAGEVVVSVEADAETGAPQRIDVTDTGVGIPADRIEVIFEAFEQADRSTARRFGGSGLGLSISRGLCEQLGFTLSAVSEVGKGSTFTVQLQPSGRAAAEGFVHA